MKHDWVLDVLSDLQRFAAQNRMGNLAGQLAITRMIASVDLASQTEGVQVNAHGEHSPAGYDSGEDGGVTRA